VRTHIIPEWEALVPKLNKTAVGIRKEFGYPLLAFMGDDHVPRTPMWAHTLIAVHRAGIPVHRHSVEPMARWASPAIVYGRDGIQDKRLPTWWSMDGRLIDRLGRMVPAPVQHLYCDNAVKALGERINALCYLDEVLIEHMHPIVGKARMDMQYARVNSDTRYASDRAAFDGWVRDGLDQDATLLADIWR
jgi:hypothetical protein